jgi:hypothetical protein
VPGGRGVKNAFEGGGNVAHREVILRKKKRGCETKKFKEQIESMDDKRNK